MRVAVLKGRKGGWLSFGKDDVKFVIPATFFLIFTKCVWQSKFLKNITRMDDSKFCFEEATMRKTVVSGVLIAGLLMAQAAMAAGGNAAQIKALHEQEKTLRAQMRANPSQIPALMNQLKALRVQERSLRQQNIEARLAARKAASGN